MRLGQGYVDPLSIEDPRINSELARSRQLGDEAVRVLGQLGNLQAPEAVRPAYRTEDLIGLLVGGLLSGGGREIAPLVQGFQQGKLGKAQQDTERNQANFNNRIQQTERQANQLGQRSNSARLAAEDLIQGQERRRNTIRQAQQGARDAEERKEKRLQDARLTRIEGIQGAIQDESRTLLTNFEKLETKQRQDIVKRINSLVENNPDIANELLPVFDVPIFGKETPRDILLKADTDLTNQKAKFEKIKTDNYVRKMDADIRAIDSRIKVDDARIAKTVKETELLPEAMRLKARALAVNAFRAEWYAQNLDSLVTNRGDRTALAVIDLKKNILRPQFAPVDAALKAVDKDLKAIEDAKIKEAQANGEDSDAYLKLVEQSTVMLTRQAELRAAKNLLIYKSAELDNEAEDAVAPFNPGAPKKSTDIPLNVGGSGGLKGDINKPPTDKPRGGGNPPGRGKGPKITNVVVTSK
jgi:hypothetical protein